MTDLPPITARRLLAGSSAGYLYVVRFVSGVIKVGRTKNPRSRLATHQSLALIHGGDVTDWWVSEPVDQNAAEVALIQYCRTACSDVVSGEHYRGLDFPAVVACARNIAERHWVAPDGLFCNERPRALASP